MQWYDADLVTKYPIFTGTVWYFQPMIANDSPEPV